MQERITAAQGHRPTADAVLEGQDLSGQRFLVTGGYSGIGLETCRSLARAHANVVVAGRDLRRAGEVASELRGLGGGTAEPLEVDLADRASIDASLAAFGPRGLQGIVANAGVMACPHQRTADGWEWQLGVNVLGHARLVWGLLPNLLEATSPPRVVMLSSSAHKLSPFVAEDPHYRDRSYDKWEAYGQSKTGDSLLAVALQASGAVPHLDAFAVHPGGILTPLQRHLPHAEMVAMGWIDEDGQPTSDAFKTPEQGAATQTWAATAPELHGRGGRYLEDCGEALPATPKDRYSGVAEHAVDLHAAELLWRFCERELEVAAPM